ncbi:hypothetical protein CLV51_103205 [Chitinophaga niastensis]|uniref:DUF4175 family protein n=1 Tax=Chitinophaga niastensis TaxID=536980 RepID=A0A2P8HJ33_CHINA|nr:hypothetical protein [Chitinophaga niastensis]PSL46229.1 hypothetical protein CLV51_103205 [Chitinophaga niastensis]
MHNSGGYTKIETIRLKWIRQQVGSCLILSIAVALPAFIVRPLYGLLCFVLALLILLFLKKPWQLQANEVARYLDQSFPALEDSTGLILKGAAEHSLLEQLQARKTGLVLEALQLPVTFYQPVKKAILFLAVSMLISTGIWYGYYRRHVSENNTQITAHTAPEEPLPGITGVRVSIQPPAYTHKTLREQPAFNITAEDSALLRWELHTNVKVQELLLLFNDSTQLALQPDKDSLTWTATRLLRKSGFYQVQLNKQLSALYQLQMLPDLAPVIQIITPSPYTVIEFGQSAKVNVQVTVSDDYGIHAAFIAATIASGSGEAVRFREQQLAFDHDFSGHATKYQLNKQLNLTALGLKPGDELYFNIAATDTRLQQTRSDVYIITLPDTAQLFSMEGIVNGVNFKPEYFRSQRQIIIETEQLIRDQDSLGKEKFKDHSNDLGTDQKLLRLRYGKFLGEESESNVGDPRVAAAEGEHDQHETHKAADHPDFGNAAKILDEFTDKHDNAEDATFLDAAVKQQLKATLTEMWKAELQLRLYKPQDALPFEYKALRLLKDLQQQSRIYVAKTGVKTTPLKPEKRLTGELDKINPATTKGVNDAKDESADIRIALSVLEALKTNKAAAATPALQKATLLLSAKAAAAPAQYLSALEAMHRITQSVITLTDIRVAQKGLLQMLAAPAQRPQAANRSPDNGLPALYFKHLKTGNK